MLVLQGLCGFVLLMIQFISVGAWGPSFGYGDSYCQSWRVAVEANNCKNWRVVPPQCVGYVGGYFMLGQYFRDLDTVMEQVAAYLNAAPPAADGKDAWILDVDDTCLSNLFFYQGRQFGGMPFDPVAFKNWAAEGLCPAILPVLELFERLRDGGFAVFLLTGRDEEALGAATAANLHSQGFTGYERLIMRTAEHRGQPAALFKPAMRRLLADEGYRIRGNVGDQWSDLQGDCSGDRVFKVPNPMYFVP